METNLRPLFPKGQPQEGSSSDSKVVPISPKAARKTVQNETPESRPRQAELPFLAPVPAGNELCDRIDNLARMDKTRKKTKNSKGRSDPERSPDTSFLRWAKDKDMASREQAQDADGQVESDPENEPFEVEAYASLAMRDELLSMELPLFALAKTPSQDNKPYIFQRRNGRGQVRISPSCYGPATVFDNDLIIYCASVIDEIFNNGQTPSRTLVIDTADFLRKTNRSDGVLAYERIIEMLRRLCGTFIETDIPTHGIRRIKGFGIIESYELLVKKERVVSRKNQTSGKHEIKEVTSVLKFSVTLSEWQYNSIRHEHHVLAIDNAYFGLDSPIERRLYQIARHHCGDKPLWKIELKQLADKTGTRRELFKFRDDLRNVIRDDRLPGYRLAIDSQAKPNVVVFLQKAPPEDDKSPESVKKKMEINGALSKALMEMKHDNVFAWFESLETKGSPKIQGRKSIDQRKARQAELAAARKEGKPKRTDCVDQDMKESDDEME